MLEKAPDLSETVSLGGTVIHVSSALRAPGEYHKFDLVDQALQTYVSNDA